MLRLPVGRYVFGALTWPLRAATSSLLESHTTPQTPLVLCFLVCRGTGELRAFWPGKLPSDHLYFEADYTQRHPAAQRCPQLMVRGNCPVATQLCLMPRPTQDEERGFIAESFPPITLRPVPHQPQLVGMCDQIDEAIQAHELAIRDAAETSSNGNGSGRRRPTAVTAVQPMLHSSTPMALR